MLQICSNIKQERILANRTQQEMANSLNVKRTTYANWEKDTEPDMTILKSIAQILGISIGKIIGEDIQAETQKESTILPKFNRNDESLHNLIQQCGTLVETNRDLKDMLKMQMINLNYQANKPLMPKLLMEQMAESLATQLHLTQEQVLLAIGRSINEIELKNHGVNSSVG